MADASTAPPQQADAPKAKKPKTVITPEDQQLDDAVLALLNEQVHSSFQFNLIFFHRVMLRRRLRLRETGLPIYCRKTR
jgi:hypothetical protein